MAELGVFSFELSNLGLELSSVGLELSSFGLVGLAVAQLPAHRELLEIGVLLLQRFEHASHVPRRAKVIGGVVIVGPEGEELRVGYHLS